MNPNVWGPPAWDFLHTITFNYPYRPTPKEKMKAIIFFETLEDMLPCHSCRKHYQENLAKYPVRNAVSDRDTLVKWLIHIHNQVNRLLGKRIYHPHTVINQFNKKYDIFNDFDDVEPLGNRVTWTTAKKWVLIITVVLSFILLLNYYTKRH